MLVVFSDGCTVFVVGFLGGLSMQDGKEVGGAGGVTFDDGLHAGENFYLNGLTCFAAFVAKGVVPDVFFL